MSTLSYWDRNKEMFVKTALTKYKESGDLSGYDILRYAEKGVLKTPEYTVDELKNWKLLGLGYVILRLAKKTNSNIMRFEMKVSELENQLWFGDVIIQCIDTNIITGEPMKHKGYVEFIVTWVRNENQDGPRDANDPNDFDVILMDNNGEIIHIRDIKSLDNWEYSHCAFKFGAYREGDEKQ